MFNWLKFTLWGNSYSDIVNEVTGLSERDIDNIRHSWSNVYKNKLAFGMDVFIRLFQEFPDTKNFFKSFLNVPNEDLPKTAQFKAHVINFMNGFNSVIMEIHNPDVSAALCMKIGTTHGSRLIKEEHFEVTKKIIYKLLSEELKLDEATLISWERFINFIYRNIYPELKIK